VSYNNDNQVALWKNEDRKSDKHPNLKGSATVNGVEYWASAWTNKAEGNKPIVKISLTPKEKQAVAPAAPVEEFEIDDELPF
jgi:hypothetical protein